MGQPFSNLKLNPNRILFWEKRDKNPVVICQYIKAIFFQSNKIIFNAVPFLCKQDGLKFTLNSHKRALRQSTSVPNSRSAENIWALINISIWHYHFFVYTMQQLWYGKIVIEKFLFDFLFIYLTVVEYYNVSGTVHRLETSGDQHKTYIQRRGNKCSTSQEVNSPQIFRELATINKI